MPLSCSRDQLLQVPASSGAWTPSKLSSLLLDGLDLQEGMLYLDAGCGRGAAASLAARRGVHVFCVDPSPEQLELAASALPAADFRAAALDQLPFPNGVFDSILAFDSLHRALDPYGAIRELARVCTRGGRIAIAMPAAVANSKNGLESAIDLARLHPIDTGEVEYQPYALAPLQRMSFAVTRK